MMLILLTVLTRIVCICFLVAAGFSIPQAWRLNESEYTRGGNDNKTVSVPIEICDKQSVAVDGQVIIFPGNQNASCHTLEYLINACVASIMFAGVAMLIFFVFDVLARCKAGPVSRSSVLGMSFFMTFILIQAGACCYALYKECKHWEVYFMDRFDELETDQFNNVKTYGNKLYFIVTCFLALGCALLLLLDTLFNCCARDGEKKPKPEPPAPESAPEEERVAPAAHSAAASVGQSSMDGHSFAQDSAIDEESTKTKKWTNY
jgi:hypothetical protein